jgi:hypothetical protein
MLAALFIALIGIASHMSIQVFLFCARLIPGYNLAFIDPSHWRKKQLASPLVLSLSHVQQIQPHSWIWRNAAVLRLILFCVYGR